VKETTREINVSPLEVEDFTLSHSRMDRQQDNWAEMSARPGQLIQ
jgi:hypothetical protein